MAGIQDTVLVRSVDGYDDPRLATAIRELLELDPETVTWMREPDPGRLVVVKPNWVQESHLHRPDVWEPVITHPAVVLEVLERVAHLMGGQGTICMCDAPITGADFEAITLRGGLKDRLSELGKSYPRLKIELLDLRREVWIVKEDVVVKRLKNPHDPRGYVSLDLGRDSLLYSFQGEGRYYGADYDAGVVNQHHDGEKQEYLLAGTPMACDLFINLPKLKTHKKTGVTCCLKNLVGINGDKNWLPHHTEGAPSGGGDAFPAQTLGRTIEKTLKIPLYRMALDMPVVGPWILRKGRNVGKGLLGDSDRVIRNGNWEGNDTCWRMALDLNRTLLYGNMDGSWRQSGPKRYLAIVDGIIGGEGNGPLAPEPVESRVLIGGINPAVVDATACRLMGIDPSVLPIVRHAFDRHRFPIATGSMEDIEVEDDRVGMRIRLGNVQPAVPGGFVPHFGWPSLRKPGADTLLPAT